MASLGLVGIAAAFAVLTHRWAVARLHVSSPADMVHFVTLPDGCRLALWRYRPGKDAHGEPVILCHGLTANRFNFDLDGGSSLARRLRAAGYDVFLVELRGYGLSGAGAGEAAGGHYDFDTFVADAPVVLREVLALTGRARAFWVGHSMGGMLGYTLAAGPEAGKLAGLVTIGSPVRFGGAARLLIWPVRLHRMLLPFPAPIGLLARVCAPLATGIVAPGISGWRWRRVLANCIHDISRGELAQVGQWLRTGRFCSRDGRIDYLERLPELRVPLLVIGGGKDRLCPPAVATLAHARAGSPDKELHIEPGDNHGSLVFGKRAIAEVLPRIEAWIEARRTGAPRRASSA